MCDATVGCSVKGIEEIRMGWDTKTNSGVYGMACASCYAEYIATR
jgi:hypothetical protein